MLPEVLKVNLKKREVILESGGVEYTVWMNKKNKPRIVAEISYTQIYDPLRASNKIRGAVRRRAAAILNKPYRPPRRNRSPRQLQLLLPF